MAIEIKNTDLVYFPIPKVASTSLKHFLYEVNHGSAYTPDTGSSARRRKHVHNHDKAFAAVPFERLKLKQFADKKRIAVVRDPVERILSAYSNRVLKFHELSEAKIDMGKADSLGLTPNPSLSQFILNLEGYRELAQSISHHTDIQAVFLGHDRSYYDHMFPMHDVPKLADLVNKAAGTQVRVEHRQVSPKISVYELTQEELSAVRTYCEKDYEFLSEFFTPPAGNLHASASLASPSVTSDGTVQNEGETATKPKPFIIWTVRRSGGTNLAHFLFQNSPFPSTEHEPLNRGRRLGYITEAWDKDRNPQVAEEQLRSAMASRMNIKHCVDAVPRPITDALAKVSCELGYEHLFLLRADPLDRLLSLEFAKTTGIWNTKQHKDHDMGEIARQLAHTDMPIDMLLGGETQSRNILSGLYNSLTTQGLTPSIAVFEDIYATQDLEISMAFVDRLCDQFGLGEIDPEKKKKLFLGKKTAKTSYQGFRNYQEFARSALELGRFRLGEPAPQLKKPNIQAPGSAIFNLFPVVRSWRSDLVRINGVGIDPENPYARWQVGFDGKSCQTFNRLRSQGFQSVNPTHENSSHARFSAIDVPESQLRNLEIKLG